MNVLPADNTIKNGWNLPSNNSKADVNNINTPAKFGENPLIFTKVIVQKWKYGHVPGR